MAKILIIDDDIAICELIKINLELQGHNCLYATEPTKGFALVKQESPNLVVLVVMMGAIRQSIDNRTNLLERKILI